MSLVHLFYTVVFVRSWQLCPTCPDCLEGGSLSFPIFVVASKKSFFSPFLPNQQTNFQLSSDAEILLIIIQIGAKRQKPCMQCVHIPTELLSCIPPLVVGHALVNSHLSPLPENRGGLRHVQWGQFSATQMTTQVVAKSWKQVFVFLLLLRETTQGMVEIHKMRNLRLFPPPSPFYQGTLLCANTHLFLYQKVFLSPPLSPGRNCNFTQHCTADCETQKRETPPKKKWGSKFEILVVSSKFWDYILSSKDEFSFSFFLQYVEWKANILFLHDFQAASTKTKYEITARPSQRERTKNTQLLTRQWGGKKK